jgi:hypothetical protein
MRAAAASLLVTLVLLCATLARAAESRRAVADGSAALSAEPPRRDAARAALERAVAAADDADAVAEARWLLGKIDEDEGAFARALDEDAACVAAAPNSRWAQRASDRIDWLRARSEGDFAPLARLERVRRDPALSSDPAAVAELARDADAFPPGTVRVEARMLVAEAWLGRLHRPEDALAQLRKVRDDPKADPLTARLAERELVDALVAEGRLDEAAAEARARANRLDPRFVRQTVRLVRRRSLRWTAVGALAGFVGLAGLALARATRRGAIGAAGRAVRSIAPIAVAFALYVGCAGGELASQYESGNSSPFIALAAAVLPILLLARAWGAVGSAGRAARAGRSLLCAATVVAAAFVLLDAMNPAYLEGFGL